MKPTRWQDWLNIILGAWLIASPWALGFADTQPAAGTTWVLGAAIAIFAGTAAYMPKAWEEAVSIVLGLCLLASPWMMGFADHSTAMANAVILGALVVAFSLWAMLQDADFKKWLEQHRHVSGTR